jgi:hypothetical protein
MGRFLVARFQDTSGDAQGRLLSHLVIDEAPDEPGIGDLTFVAVVDAVLLGGRSLAVLVLVNDTRCALGCSGDGDPLSGLRILDRVTLPDLRQRHLLYCVFRTHYRPGSSGGGSVGVASE